MWCKTNTRFAVAIIVLASCGLGGRPAAGAELSGSGRAAGSGVSTDRLLELAREAKLHFQPLPTDHVERAKAQLQRRIGQLDQALRRSGPENAQRWKEYLQWERMATELAKAEGPDPRRLGSVVGKYVGDFGSLELPVFTRVREALVAYLTALEKTADPDLEASYQKRLDGLIQMLPHYEAHPTVELRQQIGQSLGWLENACQASAFVAAVRQRHWQPNLYAEVSERLISHGMGEAVAEESDVEDCILGTAIFGRAAMRGRTRVRLIDHPDHAHVEVVLTGTVHSSNVGYNRGVQIFSRGTTGVDAVIPVYLDPAGFTAGSALASCATASVIDRIAAQRCLVERIAWRKATRSKPQAEQIASAHAEVRIEDRVAEQADRMLADARETYESKFRRPLVRRGEFPQDLQFRTQQGFLKVVWRQANAAQLAAPNGPPRLDGPHDVAVRLHESMVSNFSRAAIGGVKLTGKKLVEMLEQNKLDVPETLRITEDTIPWSITFASDDPASAVFDGNTIRFAIRGRRFENGDNVVNRLMEMSAVYTLEKTPEGARLIRQGDVSVDYLDQEKIGNKEVVIRTVMRQKFESLFAPEFRTTGITLPGRWQQAGPLHLEQVVAQKGWLSLAWRLAIPPQPDDEPTMPDEPGCCQVAQLD